MKTDRQIDIMGIVNLTEDSFYAGSRCAGAAEAMRRIEKMQSEGVDIIDLGPCSSRPGAVPVGPEEEWRRLQPVLEILRQTFPDIRLSIDTSWSSVVERAYDVVGSFIVNDISAGEDDPLMLPLAARLGLEYVAMHKKEFRGDVTEAVKDYFDGFSSRAMEAGLKDWILDPGFGFAKTVEQNHQLLKDMGSLKTAFGGMVRPILAGVSRKSMIYKPLGISPEDALPATQAVHMAALANGADILRVHDVREAKQTVSLYRMLY